MIRESDSIPSSKQELQKAVEKGRFLKAGRGGEGRKLLEESGSCQARSHAWGVVGVFWEDNLIVLTR